MHKIVRPKLQIEVESGAKRGDSLELDDLVVEMNHYTNGLPSTVWRVVDLASVYINHPTVKLRSLTSGQVRNSIVRDLIKVRLL